MIVCFGGQHLGLVDGTRAQAAEADRRQRDVEPSKGSHEPVTLSAVPRGVH